MDCGRCLQCCCRGRTEIEGERCNKCDKAATSEYGQNVGGGIKCES